jgi:hypothetical protein
MSGHRQPGGNKTTSLLEDETPMTQEWVKVAETASVYRRIGGRMQRE